MSALALVISFTGITGADAVTAVKRALSARNADAVDGISASRKPQAGRLYPLGPGARFPSSVLPRDGSRGLRGPMGPIGLPGLSGPAGTTSIRLANAPGVRLPTQATAAIDVARLDNLPAGNWLLWWSATADYGGATTSAWCLLRIGSVELAAADATVGTSTGGASAAVITAAAATVQPGPFSVVLRCYQTNNLPAGSTVGIDSQHIVAIRADTLEVTGG